MAGRVIDLRSDTVTRPSPGMRRTMAEAEVGDDWYGDDPTVNRLQERAAEVTGKEAALYVPTGTMANQIALHAFARGGHFVVCEATSHVTDTEGASSAMISGVEFFRLPGDRGRISAEQVAAALQPDPYEVAVVDLVWVEDTHNFGGGTVTPVDDLRAVRKVADEAGVPLYLDGARVFNAAAATGAPVAEFAGQATAMMFALSKGLGCPVGSLLCGDAELIKEGRRLKILLGGAWRQAGIVAAAGLFALSDLDAVAEQLGRDHALARRLAEGLAELAPGSIDPATVDTNMVWVHAGPFGVDPWDLYARLGRAGVLSNVLGDRIRLVTHRDVTAADVDETIVAWRDAVSEARREGSER